MSEPSSPLPEDKVKINQEINETDERTGINANIVTISPHYELEQKEQLNIQKRNYTKYGYLTPLRVLKPKESQQMYNEYQAWVGTLPNQSISGDLRFKPHLYLPFISRIVHHPIIVSTVVSILQTSNVLLWSSDFNIKNAHTPNYFALHQDSTYTGLFPADLGVTVWLAISDPVDKLHGCMTFWEGSHQWGQLPHVEQYEDVDNSKTQDNKNMLSRGQEVLEHPYTKNNDANIITANLRGGEASIHNFYLLHQSGPNNGNQPRIGLAMRYIAASVKQKGKTREMVTLVSGSLEHDGFDLEPILPHDLLYDNNGKNGCRNDHDLLVLEQCVEEGKKAHREAMRRERLNYFDGSEVKSYL